ncbi:hypothetical protein CHH57_01840 [Niallia circulans]|uniref:Uncharacterized protein n=1 Tax=Niallia circulans TaxID=1397 RepID=A0AA91Z2X8_NIACI|nr:UPF0489 family protein [Niallia circulans]PAD84939.1 hypothetical protein CHH57_01840 [Niallia circulans]
MDINNTDLRFCFPDKNIYISRDHNFAFAAWEIARLRNIIKPNASLIHIDNHLDYCDPELSKTINIKNEKDAIELASGLDIAEFIIAGQFTGTIGKCFTISDDGVDVEQSEVFKRAYTYNHYEQIYRRKWFEETEGTDVILDLDLDFFNTNTKDYNNNPILLSDDIVKTHLKNIKECTWSWDLITVALSPEHCGGDEASLYLLNLFLEVFELKIEEAVIW